METFWFFRLRLCRAEDSAYDPEFWFSPGNMRSYDSTYDSDSEFLIKACGLRIRSWKTGQWKSVEKHARFVGDEIRNYTANNQRN